MFKGVRRQDQKGEVLRPLPGEILRLVSPGFRFQLFRV